MENKIILGNTRESNYTLLLETAPLYLEEVVPWYTKLANLAALIDTYTDTVNWVGFYLYDQGRLVLGPFQGKVACTVIELGKGVCGEAAKDHKTMLVEDVTTRKNHIFCDPDSQSELVVPLVKDNKLIGVLDIDSPIKNRFGEPEKTLFEAIAALIVDNWI